MATTPHPKVFQPIPMTIQPNLVVLALAQGLLTLNNVTLIAINGLQGLALARDKSLATLPVAAFVAGSALATLPASFFMQRHGRRAGFRLGAVLGLGGGLLALAGSIRQDFLLLCLGSLMSGFYNAFGQQYRFAAADAVHPEWQSRAISLTLAGGILGGVAGPELGKWTRDLLEPLFVASYGSLTLFTLLAWGVLGRLHPPPPTPSTTPKTPTGPFWPILTRPVYLVAVLAATTGYGVMNLLMSATPLVMQSCHLPFDDAAFVLEWHVLGMFVPSFFTGSLIHRFGVSRILLVGVALMFGCNAVALSGQSLSHFWWALLLLGVAWNFLYVGGSSLLITTCQPEEKAMAQGFNDLMIFSVQTMTALSSGMIANQSGWEGLNQGALPATGITALALLWLHRHQGNRNPHRKHGEPT
ncbi:MAG: MFS transporter [Magnetococcales bacterium]|nr:MFS transporter [Magnetococcales bacterium]